MAARIRKTLFWLISLSLVLARASAQTPDISPDTIQQQPLIVIGFVGGFFNEHNRYDGVVRFASYLQDAYGSKVHVEVFRNHRRGHARKRVLQLLDTNHDGKLSAEEKQNANIIVYGESWGGSATIAFARDLEKRSIPVLLTAQIDSVGKPGQDHRLIPANVLKAVSFYQLHGLVHGPREIRAADPDRTLILGNFRFDYREHPVRCDRYSLFERVFGKDHMEIECDPKVWSKVNLLIQSQIPARQQELAGSVGDFSVALEKLPKSSSFYESIFSGGFSPLRGSALAPSPPLNH